MNPQDWVTVLTVPDEIEANLKKGFLEDAGIECEIDSSPFRAYPFLSRFSLNVPWHRLDEAKEVLNEMAQ